MKSQKPKKQAKSARKAPSKTTKQTARVPIPPILLEGDKPASPTAPLSGPGERFAARLAPATVAAAPAASQQLPEAYGTQRLLLLVRDPHWLYACWDLTIDQIKGYDADAAEGHLVLRLFKDAPRGQPLSEVSLHADSRHWFVHVPEAGATYAAELGYYQRWGGRWMSVSISESVQTPPEQVSEDVSAWFATLPAEVQLESLVRLVKAAVPENRPLLEAMRQLRVAGHEALPTPQSLSTGRWTPEQERALAEVIHLDATRRAWLGSLEITGLLQPRPLEPLRAGGAGWGEAAAGALASLALGSVSSPFGGGERAKKSWFNVNAELIVYGATEPDAEVKLGGRVIRLRPDGTFSYRFALPDGEFTLPVQAVSADRTDRRGAELRFSRHTEYRGEVGQSPQDPNLKPPCPEP